MNPTKFFPRALRVPALVALTVALWTLSMPGPNLSGAAWFFAVPFALWAARRPAWKTWLAASWAACFLAGVVNLVWLRHLYPPLGWVALLLLPLAYTAFPWLWFVALRFVMPRCTGERAFPSRVVDLLGLTGLWLVLEWMLTWFLTGFPWMPIGATQWDFPAALALCRFAGTPAASATVIFFNLGLARYLRRQFVEARVAPASPSPFGFLRTFCPEFYLALAPVFASVVVFAYSCVEYDRGAEKKFSFAAVQTDFDPNAKWDARRVSENLRVLETLTLAAPTLSRERLVATFPQAESALAAERKRRAEGGKRLATDLDFVLWPEAAMPVFPLEKSDANGFAAFLKGLAREAGTALVVGAVAPAETAGGAAADAYHNSVHVVDPRFGLADAFAAKRHLVPFGEYVPLADVLPLRKVVPVASDCVPGASAEPLLVRSRENRVLRLGALVCYEDVFPELGRECVAAGAEALVVVTNDAWYGREAGAHQHMAHSVMQAVSLGVPVVRCGNAGWSGVISPIGQIQPMTDAAGSIYFRGVGRFDVYGRRAASPTFYALHGDWLVFVGAGFFALAAVARLLRRSFAERNPR